MAKKEVVVQHTPKHLEGDGPFDPRHPAASSFAPMQPALGVVADDADERGQNLQGGEKASKAHKANRDQREKLAQQHKDDLARQHDLATPDPVKVDGDSATPAKK